MKKLVLMAAVALTAAVFVTGAVACGDDNNDNGDKTPAATEANMTPNATELQATEMAGETPAGNDATETAEYKTPQAEAPVVVTLNAMASSGVTGTATLTANADGTSTSVGVVIDGGLTEGEHQNHIHTGQCEAQGDVQDALTPLQAAADGTATGETPAVPEALSVFEGGNNYVAIHAADGAVVACGNIPVM